MRITKRICAALAALTMTAGLASAAEFPPGAWLPITNIIANTGQPVTLDWDDFSDLVGLEVWTTEQLDAPDWQPLSVTRGGETVTRFALNELGLVTPSLTPTRFYRLRGVRGDGSGTGGGAPTQGSDGSWYINIGTNGLGDTVYVKVGPDGTVILPPTLWTNVVTDAVQVWPAAGACGCGDTCNCLENNGIIKVEPDGTIVVLRPKRTPVYNPDLVLEPGDVIVPPLPLDPIVVGEPGGHYDNGLPGIVLDTDPQVTILIPSGTTLVADVPPYVTVVGPDGKRDTDDDVTICPAGLADVDTGTGIVTVPGGSVISTNGAPVVVPGVNGTLVPPGSFPPGTIVLPNGTIIVPANPPNSPATPIINPDGTVTVGPGDTILLPPYDNPFVVDAPGGIFDPNTVPPTITTVPGGVVIPVIPPDNGMNWNGVGHTIAIDLTSFVATRVANNAAVVDPNVIYMRYINPGGFRMGTPAGEMRQTALQKDVTLSGYYIGVYTVTEAQWQKVMGGSATFPSNPKAGVSYNMIRGNSNTNSNSTYSKPDYEIPATTTTTGSFMARLRAGVQGVNPGIKFDLPTEAQWEYACRAGTTGTFSDGNDIWASTSTTLTQAQKTRLSAIAWWGGTAAGANGGSAAHAVGALAPNAAGLYDMHGNVWEWCRDNWDSALPTGDSDPLRIDTGSSRSRRGGHWGYTAYGCRSAFGEGNSAPSSTSTGYGFRLAAFGAVVAP